MFTCPRCNTQLPNGTRFCSNCGLQFDQSGQPALPPSQVPPGQPYQGGQFQPAQPPKKKSFASRLLGLGCIAVIVFIVLMVIGVMVGNKGSGSGAGSSTSSSSGDSSSSSAPDNPPAPAAISVSANQLSAAYNANEVSADDKYKDKLIAVTGTVDSIGKDITDTPYVTLQASGDLLGVQCMFDDQYKGQLGQFQKGQHVTFHGTCKGKTLNVLLADCTPN